MKVSDALSAVVQIIQQKPILSQRLLDPSITCPSVEGDTAAAIHFHAKA